MEGRLEVGSSMIFRGLLRKKRGSQIQNCEFFANSLGASVEKSGAAVSDRNF